MYINVNFKLMYIVYRLYSTAEKKEDRYQTKNQKSLDVIE